MYMGEELGLEDAVVPEDRIVDPADRDGCRAPVPWRRDAGHGWPEPSWLPLPPEAGARSHEAQRDDGPHEQSRQELRRHVLREQVGDLLERVRQVIHPRREGQQHRRDHDIGAMDQAGARAPAILENRMYRSLTGSFAGAQEYMAIERLHQLHESALYDVIVIDTPPSRHAREASSSITARQPSSCSSSRHSRTSLDWTTDPWTACPSRFNSCWSL